MSFVLCTVERGWSEGLEKKSAFSSSNGSSELSSHSICKLWLLHCTITANAMAGATKWCRAPTEQTTSVSESYRRKRKRRKSRSSRFRYVTRLS
jgi:hypothetical protein